MFQYHTKTNTQIMPANATLNNCTHNRKNQYMDLYVLLHTYSEKGGWCYKLLYLKKDTLDNLL
jgi:hypothetical protein